MQVEQEIDSAITIMDDIATLFYQQKNKEGKSKLDQFLTSSNQTLNQLILYQSNLQTAIIDEMTLNTILSKTMTAMEQDDYILFSDILTFELKDLFEDYKNRL